MTFLPFRKVWYLVRALFARNILLRPALADHLIDHIGKKNCGGVAVAEIACPFANTLTRYRRPAPTVLMTGPLHQLHTIEKPTGAKTVPGPNGRAGTPEKRRRENRNEPSPSALVIRVIQ